MKTFSDYIQIAQKKNTVSIDDSWAQGRSIFGGLSAALILAHVKANIDFEDKELRSANINFCAAIEVQTECQLSFTVLSNGKSVMQIQGQLVQHGVIRTMATFCFGRQRASTITIDTAKHTPRDQTGISMPFLAGIAPNFIQHIDLKFSSQHLPFSGLGDGHVHGLMAFKQASASMNDTAILALIDAWPPAILPMLKTPAPASTITWNVEFIQPSDSLKPDDFLYYDCQVIQAEQGYAHTEGKIYHPNGTLLALSRQLVGVYDKQ